MMCNGNSAPAKGVFVNLIGDAISTTEDDPDWSGWQQFEIQTLK